MFENEKITKVIFSNEKAIVATQIEQMYDKNFELYNTLDTNVFEGTRRFLFLIIYFFNIFNHNFLFIG